MGSGMERSSTGAGMGSGLRWGQDLGFSGTGGWNGVGIGDEMKLDKGWNGVRVGDGIRAGDEVKIRAWMGSGMEWVWDQGWVAGEATLGKNGDQNCTRNGTGIRLG